MRPSSVAALTPIGLLAGCLGDWGPPEGWADKSEIIEAASRCGLQNFKPTEAGGAWAAYVSHNVPDHAAKEDCIYSDLEGQGLKVTR